MKKQLRLAGKSIVMASALMAGAVIYGAVAHPNDLVAVWIDRGALMAIGSIIANTFADFRA